MLIVCLKRFRVERGRYSFYHKSKIRSLIDFPLDSLDLSPYVAGPQPKDELIYDCFGICNHSGSSGCGHYTSFVRTLPSGNWFLCNDAQVSELSSSISPDRLVTPKAYVLFFQSRKKKTTTTGHEEQSKETTSPTS